MSPRLISFGMFAAALAATTPVAAQQPAPVPSAPQATPSKDGKGWRVQAPALSITSERDDNVFLVTESKKDDIGTPGTASVASRRYEGMLSAADLITTVEAKLAIQGTGMSGRPLVITPVMRYEYYAENTDRRNATFGLDLEQSLGHGNEVRLRGRMTPSYFARNYLADATDIDGNGSIAPAERSYRRGTYAETELTADYRRRLDESTKSSPFGAAIRLGAGYYARTFDAPFAGRDLAGPMAKVALMSDVSRRVKVELGYELGILSASPTDEVLLLDEQDVGADLNGNGRMTDVDVRSVQRVDRSRVEHVIVVGGGIELTSRTDLGVQFEHRRRRYGSGEPLDVSYNGRSDARNRLSVELSTAVSRRFSLGINGGIASQSLSRERDFGATGEVDDYSRHIIGLRVGYRF